ncbi:MAG: chitobiase/beta-hexosaminidase C-terminal domain-containing protein [Lachnospiraceae bacterium]|nr:chitobiase/beta-hexosaminidase C-terminal domain-containing protein [Lachnospiraceae bacterium]
MVCPKCGEEIKEGFLYCSKCGEEIKMVPDFEVELEVGIEQTISEVAELIADSVEEASSDVSIQDEEFFEPDNAPVPAPEKQKSKRKNIGPGLLVAAALILGLLFVFGIYRLAKSVENYYSFEFQYEKAKTEFNDGDYEAAIKTARHVLSIDKKEAGPRSLLADSYLKLEKYDEAIAVLNDMLDDDPDDISVYERLLKCYEAEGDTDSIVRLAGMNTNKDIAYMFSQYSSSAPLFGIEEGIYHEPQELTLTHDGEGSIHYTLDGSDPTVDSAKYVSPIPLDEGETTVSAIYVNEKGVVSEPVSKTYDIEIIKVALPRLLTQAGDYSMPQLIKLEEPMEGIIHYTSDGTEPNTESPEYEPPVLMPLGKSEFKFIVVNALGNESDVVSAEYNLSIKGLIDASYAQSAVQLTLVTLGHPVMDHEFKANYGYSHEDRSFYVIEEYAGGKKQNTTYAVDAQTGEVFTLTRNVKRGDYDFGMVM